MLYEPLTSPIQVSQKSSIPVKPRKIANSIGSIEYGTKFCERSSRHATAPTSKNHIGSGCFRPRFPISRGFRRMGWCPHGLLAAGQLLGVAGRYNPGNEKASP